VISLASLERIRCKEGSTRKLKNRHSTTRSETSVEKKVIRSRTKIRRLGSRTHGIGSIYFMKKQLSEMTLQELWELFPIFLVPHKKVWGDYYREAEAALKKILPTEIFRIEHIGSTAIGTIMAKDIVDILLEVKPNVSVSDVAEKAEQIGFIRMSQSPDRISLNFGYTPDGFAEKVFHLHLRRAGDNDELYFRDYLIDHPDVACAYESLKISLWKQFEHDRDGYTEAKSDFIRTQTTLARSFYRNRYSFDETN